VARIIGHTGTKVRIELRIDEGVWTHLRGQFESEGLALRAVRVLFEDSVRVALLSRGADISGCLGSCPPVDRGS
jgi:hypothetical protein